MGIKGTTLFVKALLAEGVDTLFGYPGGYAIDLFDELYHYPEINIILGRHEQALVHAADGYARVTGKPGVCLVTSGPGATNLVTGIATANYDSVPLVCFTGQVPLSLIGNDAFQEVDIIGITRSICKYGVTVRDRKDLGRIIKESFYIAATGRPGPVVIDLPKDVVLAECAGDYPKSVSIRGYKPPTGVHQAQMKKALERLDQAEKPVLLIGGGVNIAGAREELRRLAAAWEIPVITTIMGKGAIDTDSPYYVGNIGMHGCYAANMAISQSDLLFSIGARFNDRITGKLSEFAPKAEIVHIDIDSSSISRSITVDIPIVADAKTALLAMLSHDYAGDNQKWLEEIRGWQEEEPMGMGMADEDMTPENILGLINKLYDEPIVVTDVGQHQMWTTQFLEMTGDTRLLTSGGLGTMGYGLPAALGAKLACPERQVICVSGDGGVQMNIQELATAVTYGLPVTVCIFNNNTLGMVRQWQELFYDERYVATCTRRRSTCPGQCGGPGESCPPYVPDFVQLAESYGAVGLRVETLAEGEKALAEARDRKDPVPTVIEFIIKKEELVLPMVQGGKALTQMITGNGGEGR